MGSLVFATPFMALQDTLAMSQGKQYGLAMRIIQQ